MAGLSGFAKNLIVADCALAYVGTEFIPKINK